MFMMKALFSSKKNWFFDTVAFSFDKHCSIIE